MAFTAISWNAFCKDFSLKVGPLQIYKWGDQYPVYPCSYDSPGAVNHSYTIVIRTRLCYTNKRICTNCVML